MMMSLKRALVALLLLTLLPLATDAAENPPKLVMTDVESDWEERIRAYNGNFFERKVYYAKRWRVVEVRPEVLFSNRAVRISPFPGVDLVLHRLDGPDVRGADLTWAARVESPAVSMDEQDRDQAILDFMIESNPQLRPHEDRLRREARIGANFIVTPWHVDESTGIARDLPPLVFPRLPASDEELKPQPEPYDRSDGAIAPSPDSSLQNTIFSFGGTITDPVRKARYRITPLEFSPRYHLIMEIDDSRDLGRIPPGPERDLALARLAEFEASLPTEHYPERLGEIQ